MTEYEKDLFKQALIEGLSNRFQREIDRCTESIRPSRRHNAAMKAILKGESPERHARSIRMRRIAAILVAALLLLASCAIVYREQIRNFIEEIYESFIKVSYSDGEEWEHELEEIYELTYVPEGYALEEEFLSAGVSRIKYASRSGDTVLFEQRVLDTASFYLDIENGYTKLDDIQNSEVYYRNTVTRHYYLWNDGKYTIMLMSTIEMSDDELMLIIGGIKAK